MLFLRVENKVQHIPDIDFLTTVGESTSRGSDSSIGQFGSGFVYTLALFARKGILSDCKICLGNDVYTPFVKSENKKDGSGFIREISKICLKRQNGGTYDLNISKGFGEIGWNDITMGVRELISNAFDGADSYDGTYKSVSIEVVPANKCRASDGVVRVYIPITDEISDYVANIEHYFICKKSTYNPNNKVLPKSCLSPVNVYRKGVLVHSGTDKNSLFDYNVEININESRVIDSNSARDEAGKAIVMYSREDQLDKFVREILINNNENYWESTISNWDINPDYMPSTSKARERLTTSWKRVVGNGILCKDTIEKTMVEAKGLSAITVRSPDTYSLLSRLSVRKANDVLDDIEALGNTLIEPTMCVLSVLYQIWNKLVDLNLTNGRTRPPVHCFNSVVNGGAQTFGYCNAAYTEIYIHQDISEDTGNQLYQVMLEELGHYITRSTDCTRDFQSFFVNLSARLMR